MDLSNDIDVRNFLDLSFLQTFQDSLSNSLGVAAILTDVKGIPLTKPSNFSNFCNLVRLEEDGLKKCKFWDSYGGRKSSLMNKPAIYRCHSGLIDFASPILLGDVKIGYLLGGQVLTSKSDLEEIKSKIEKSSRNLSDYEKYFEEINILSMEKIKYSANLYYDLASKISNLCLFEYITNKYLKTVLDELRLAPIINPTFNSFCKNIELKDFFSYNSDIDLLYNGLLDKSISIKNRMNALSDDLFLLNKKIKKKIKTVTRITK